ncbi:MAG: sce7726 family protein [Planctomycetes bacterium]|nr:sce7726 family protein [Planctomycetota bacterium]
MAPIHDKLIRPILISKLKNQAIKPKAVIEELRVHNGNAIADVVALYKDAHCFEIKGDSDKIERAVKQGDYFNLSFRRITLVTTTKHLNKAKELLPKFWGIMIAERKGNEVTLKYIRRARNNPCFDKSLALLILWKSEMLPLVEQHDKSTKNNSRRLLAQLISRTKKKVELSNNISTALIARHYQAMP